jgi:hypothetical protein
MGSDHPGSMFFFSEKKYSHIVASANSLICNLIQYCILPMFQVIPEIFLILLTQEIFVCYQMS